MLPETKNTTDCYQIYEDFCKQIFQWKWPNTWNIKLAYTYKEDNSHEINYTNIYIDESLSYTIRIYVNLIPSQHGIYSM